MNPDKLVPINPDLKNSRISLALACCCLVGVFAPSMLGVKMMGWGYGIAFINAFLTVGALVAWWVFRARAAEWKRICGAEELLAHWSYDAETWRSFLRSDEVRERTDKGNLLRLIGFVMFFEGLLFLLIFRDFGAQIVVVIFFALWLLLAFLATVMPKYQHACRLSAVAEAFISKRGLVFAGELHSWVVGRTRLDDLTLVENSSPAYLEFSYSSPGRFTRIVTSVRVPIPSGREQEAKNLVSKLNAP